MIMKKKNTKNNVQTEKTPNQKPPVYYEIDGIMQRIDGGEDPEETDNEQCKRLAREINSPN